MRRAIHRFPLLALLGVLAAPDCFAEEPKPPAGTGLSGGWKLTSTRDDVDMKPVKESWNPLGGAETPGGTGSRGTGGGFDMPLEVMTDARRLAVTDDGTTVNVAYPSGRRRTFVTDGAKRRFDDGDGPADVTAHRAGTTVTVFSEWFRGYKLRETWELREGPRRLVVKGKLKGRESQEYVRSYEPLPPGESVFAPTPTPTPAPASEASTGAEARAAAVAPPPPAVDRMAECTIHPPRNAREDELTHLARVRQEEASKTAIASVAPAKPTDVISSDVEDFEGCLAWPFTLRIPGRKGVQEIFVDAGDGKVVRSEFIPMSSPDEPPNS